MDKKRIFTLLLSVLGLTLMLVVLNRPVASGGESDPLCYIPVIMSPCGPGALVYSDDFSDPNSGWVTFSSSEYEMSYYHGEFRLFFKIASGRLGVANTANSIAADYLLEVDVRNVDGKPGEYGVIFGFEGALELDFYTFMIDPTGDYAIYYNETTVPDPIQTTLLYSDWSAAIQPGTASNRLGVVHTASVMEFYANGELLTTLPSDRSGSEQSGMIATAGNQANLDIRFDNFEVYEYLCGGGFQGAADRQQLGRPVSFVLQGPSGIYLTGN